MICVRGRVYKGPVGFSGGYIHRQGRQGEGRRVSDDGSHKLLQQMAGELKAHKSKIQECEAKAGRSVPGGGCDGGAAPSEA